MRFISGVTLSATKAAELRALSRTNEQFAQVELDLNSGKKVNSSVDDAVSYFRSESLYGRAGEFFAAKANVDQSIQSVQTALDATSAVGGLLKQLQGVLEGARGSSLSERVSATAQFKNIGQQLAQLVKDATYQGLNLLTGTNASLTTLFSERTAATFKISGFSYTSTAAGNGNSLFTGAAIAFKSDGTINFSSVVASSDGGAGISGFSQLNLSSATTIGGVAVTASQAATIFTQSDNRIQAAISQNEALTAALGTSVNILKARSDFSQNYAQALSSGGDKLTLADLSVAAAESQALQLRQQIGTASLAGPSTQSSSILDLLRPG